MQFAIKLAISVLIIVTCVLTAKKMPSLAGLIATMPLTGLIVLIWISTEKEGSREVLIGYTKGVIWGIVPSILFYITALICLQKELPLPVALGIGFAVWLAGAVMHQMILG